MRGHVQRAALPASDLGENRNFEIGYYGHGDIAISAWQGTVDHDPHNEDGISKRFGFAHGSDVIILASMAGYLTRTGKEQEDVAQIMLGAGEGVLTDDPQTLRFYSNLNQRALENYALGDPCSRYDVEQSKLRCIVPPLPSQPGLLDETGGTGIYTREDYKTGEILYVLGKFGLARNEGGKREATLTDTEDFCETDIPVMAKMVCDLAMGEYRRDIHAFLRQQYMDEQTDDI
jgi:hypothetical protein